MQGHFNSVVDIQTFPEESSDFENIMVSASADSTIIIWNFLKKSIIARFLDSYSKSYYQVNSK